MHSYFSIFACFDNPRDYDGYSIGRAGGGAGDDQVDRKAEKEREAWKREMDRMLLELRSGSDRSDAAAQRAGAAITAQIADEFLAKLEAGRVESETTARTKKVEETERSAREDAILQDEARAILAQIEAEVAAGRKDGEAPAIGAG